MCFLPIINIGLVCGLNFLCCNNFVLRSIEDKRVQSETFFNSNPSPSSQLQKQYFEVVVPPQKKMSGRTPMWSGFGFGRGFAYWRSKTGLELFRFAFYVAVPIAASAIYADPERMNKLSTLSRIFSFESRVFLTQPFCWRPSPPRMQSCSSSTWSTLKRSQRTLFRLATRWKSSGHQKSDRRRTEWNPLSSFLSL